MIEINILISTDEVPFSHNYVPDLVKFLLKETVSNLEMVVLDIFHITSLISNMGFAPSFFWHCAFDFLRVVGKCA